MKRRNISIMSVTLLMTPMLWLSCGKDAKPTVAEAVRVNTAVAGTSELSGSTVYSGTVEESSGTSLSFPVAGTVRSINVSEGQFISKGSLIATLDDSSLRNAHQMTQAALNQARDAYDRMKKLHDANSLPDMQWVQVENTLKEAQSAEAISRKTLEDTRLYAPVSGYVARKVSDVGMNVLPGAPVVNLVTINPVKVNISVPENEISAIVQGAGTEISVSALGGARFTGRVMEKGVTANPLTRSYDVKIQVENPEHKLLPGMICDVRLDGDSGREAIVLPTGAVLLDTDNRNFVWLKRDGKASRQIVDVEGLTDGGIIISGGIEKGDSVIVAGQQKVSEGTPVVSINK